MAASDIVYTQGNVLVGGATGFDVGSTSIGPTTGPTVYRKETEWLDIECEQVTGPADSYIVSVLFFVRTTIIEPQLDTVRLAFSQPTGDLSGSTLYMTKNRLAAQTIDFTGPGPASQSRYVNLRRAYALGSVEVSTAKRENTAVDVEWKCLAELSGDYKDKYGEIIDA